MMTRTLQNSELCYQDRNQKKYGHFLFFKHDYSLKRNYQGTNYVATELLSWSNIKSQFNQSGLESVAM